MARVNAPLLSFGARGQIGKSQVYSVWKGRPYARQLVIPANPKTSAQLLTRNVFSWLNQVWKFMPTAAAESWTLYAQSLSITDRNAWLRGNISALRSGTDITPITMSPSAKSGFAAASVAAAAGAGQLTVTITAPTLPAGWSIVAGIAAAIRQQDPHSGVLYQVFSNTDTTTPYTPVIGGLTAGQVYVVGGWFKYLKPDGTNAFGQSVQTTGTPT